MSRLTLCLFAVLAIAAFPLSAQIAPPAPAPIQPQAPATVPPGVPPPAAAPVVVATPPASAPVQDPNALKFDAESKDYNAKTGDTSASFTFTVTNVSKSAIAINRLSTSCGCTVAQLPATPYNLEPGSNVAINVSMDLHGKVGQVTKTVSVDSSVGFKSLLVRANIPQPETAATTTPAGVTTPAQPGAPAMGDRAKNIQNALADRQAIFKSDCAKCHVEKGVAKMGAELYAADCGICHDAEHRAAMVPDLKVPRSARDLAFWQKWIMEGKPGTLMPAFAQPHGGPLTQDQIDSLTVYLYQTLPKNPPPPPIAPTTATTATTALVPQKN